VLAFELTHQVHLGGAGNPGNHYLLAAIATRYPKQNQHPSGRHWYRKTPRERRFSKQKIWTSYHEFDQRSLAPVVGVQNG
jgi:hypothetical protein